MKRTFGTFQTCLIIFTSIFFSNNLKALSTSTFNWSAGVCAVAYNTTLPVPSSVPKNHQKFACPFDVDIDISVPNPGVECAGTLVTLTVNATGGDGPYTYVWSTGDTTQILVLPVPIFGNFTVWVTDATGCTVSDVMHIKIYAWGVEIINPSNSPTCEGDIMVPITTPASVPGTTYLWSTGDTTQILNVTVSGTYSVTVTNPNFPCPASDSIVATIVPIPPPNPQIVGPSVLCPGQTATLTVTGRQFYAIYWSNNGGFDSTIVVNGPGEYSVLVLNNAGCYAYDTLLISSGASPPEISGPTVLCVGQSGTLKLTNAASYTDFLWSTGATPAKAQQQLMLT